MKIKGTREIEYWITRTNTNRVIRVYQMDRNAFSEWALGNNPLTLPIMIDYKGFGEDLATILEERDSLKKRVEDLEYKRSDEEFEKREKLTNRVRDLEEKLNKKWYQFWK